MCATRRSLGRGEGGWAYAKDAVMHRMLFFSYIVVLDDVSSFPLSPSPHASLSATGAFLCNADDGELLETGW